MLYELYTGKKAFTATTLPELRTQKESATPKAPAELRPGIDPVVERVIACCLERDPRQRPASAAQLAASLPGGDPLAAAIAAGETPSPGMVAASGVEGQLRPVVGISLLAATGAATLLLIWMTERTSLPQRVPFDLPPAVLVDRARAILKTIGYAETPADSAFGLEYDQEYIDSIGRTATGTRLLSRPLWRADAERSSATLFRRPALLVDAEGRLKRLEVLPPQEILGAGGIREPDWGLLFAAPGLDMARWRAIEPRWNPLYHSDARAAWEGTLPPSLAIVAALALFAFTTTLGGRRVFELSDE